MGRFIGILQFLTRITIVKDLPLDESFHRGIIFFPWVGLLLGAINLLAYSVFSYLFPSALGILLTLSLYIVLTGGLHLDGLGDTFDGFYSNRPREQILDIMKDSRLGTNGLLAIVMVLILKAAALILLKGSDLMIALVHMPIMGRLALAFGCHGAVYGRKSGLGNAFIGKVSNPMLLLVVAMGTLMTFYYPRSLIFIGILYGFSSLYKFHAVQVIGGMTGDTLGALCELSEVLYLLFLLIKLR